MPLISTTTQSPVSSLHKPSGLCDKASADHPIKDEARLKSNEDVLLNPLTSPLPTIDSWSCKFPVLEADDLTDISPCTTRLAISKPEIATRMNWDDDQYLAAVIQSVWSLVLRAYTGMDQICFGYSSPTEAPHLFACDLSHIQKPSQLVEYVQQFKRNYSLPLSSENREIGICNTALSVLVNDGPRIPQVSEEAFKQVSNHKSSEQS